MKSFQQFVSEAKEVHDREGLGGGTGMTHRTQTGKIGSERKKSELTTQLKQHKGQKKRVKAVGGGKNVETGGYKKRKDAGKQRPRSSREQQPEKERGSAALSSKEAQKKAYKERKAREKGAKTKTASELLTKKTTKPVDPKYKAAKASGYSRSERQSLTRKGEKKLRDITLAATGKKKESELKHPITHKERARRAKANK